MPHDETTTGPLGQAHRRPGEREHAVAVIVAAFAADPLMRWALPQPATYLSAFSELADMLAGTAFGSGTADLAGAAVALWFPPGQDLDGEAVGGLLARAVDDDRLPDVFELLGRMSEHHPQEEVWYLPLLGVDPFHQGRGLGSAVLAQGLARADADHRPAYLEASSPRNRALYERHGFTVVSEIQVGTSPPLWPMVRPAR